MTKAKTNSIHYSAFLNVPQRKYLTYVKCVIYAAMTVVVSSALDILPKSNYPGNLERGWNDPPQFSYGLQKAGTPQRNLLNKRAAPPVPGTGAPPSMSPSSNPLAPPPCGVATPPPLPARPPLGCMATPPPSGPMRSQKRADSSQSESEPDVEVVMSVLKRALVSCRQTVKDQVCNDMGKRLYLLQDSWRTGRLSLPVRRRMYTLTQELKLRHWDVADEIHLSLMIDHVTEVGQWMVGVKRLIAETRNLSPELLEPLLSPEGPEQKSAAPVQDPVGYDQDSAEPGQGPPEAAQDLEGSNQDPKGLDQDSAVQNPVSHS
nr:steroid receptor RNA activator 1 isoform X1 [Solea senegalensis]